MFKEGSLTLINLLHPLHTFIFAGIMLATVPRKEIRRLSIYGIIFGAMFDVTTLTFGHLTGLYCWKNYGPFGFMYIPFFAPISWALYFIMYFYFLPKPSPLRFNYFYIAAGIIFSIIYTNVVINLNIFEVRYNRFFLRSSILPHGFP